jgi:hypothetical protein
MCPYETEIWNNKFALSWWEQVKFWRDDNNDDNVCFVLDWHSWQGVLDTWWSLSATKCGRSVVFSGYWPPPYNWNIVDSGIKQR